MPPFRRARSIPLAAPSLASGSGASRQLHQLFQRLTDSVQGGPGFRTDGHGTPHARLCRAHVEDRDHPELGVVAGLVAADLQGPGLVEGVTQHSALSRGNGDSACLGVAVG